MIIPQVEIFTDGACRGNPGPGAWAALLRFKGKEKTISGIEVKTTNNRMELEATIQALRILKKPCQVILSTDSLYVKKGVTEWLTHWQQCGWLTSKKKPVKNIELWKKLTEQIERHQVIWKWVKGHSGHPENDLVDNLANAALDQLKNIKETES